MTETVLTASPDDLADDPDLETEPSEPPPVLPSERLDKLAELAAAALETGVTGGQRPVLSEQALADVWAAEDASTASVTKAAYRSDWGRFTTWTTHRGLPAGADAHATMRQTGHRSPSMLEVYAKENATLVRNAVTRLGL